jgi:hypothetical protein
MKLILRKKQIYLSFNNISAISWRPVLVVEEAEVPGENHRPWQATGKLYHLRLRVECTRLCNLQSRARTHIGDLLHCMSC